MVICIVFGCCIYVIGGNLEVVCLFGINVECIKLVVFVINGLMVVIVGLIFSLWFGVGLFLVGNIVELDVIVVCVIGGISLVGGIGSVVGVVMGVFIMLVLDNGMSMMDVVIFW